MKTIKMDLRDVKEGLICHVCNNRRAMGAGVAKSLYLKWPQVRSIYLSGSMGLGDIHAVPIVKGSLAIINMIAQDGYGRTGNRYLDYEALEICMTKVYQIATTTGRQVYIPYLMGCGLAGGDWATVTDIVDSACDSVIACRV